MSSMLAFSLAVLALLATPGPTNTLLAASGAAVGPRGSLRLIPAELAGYLFSIGVLSAFAAPVIAAVPLLAVLIKLVAGGYLAWSALRLWREASGLRGAPSPARPLRVFTTTLLNPKGLIFALVIFPGHAPMLAFPAFAALVAGVALSWILIGHMAGRSLGQLADRRRISRAAALAHVVFATLVTASAITTGG